MGIAIDAAFCAIILAAVLIGRKKGFVKSLLSFAGYVASVLLAVSLAGMLAQELYNGFFRASLIAKITGTLQEGPAADAAAKAKAIFDSLPLLLGNALRNSGVTPETLGQTLRSSAAQAAVQIADAIAPMVINLLRLFLTPVLFALFLALVRIAARAVSKVVRLPGLRQADSLLGGAFGLLSGIAAVFLISVMLQLCVPVLKEDDAHKVQQAIDSSYGFQILYQYNPVSGLLEGGEAKS